MKRVTVGLVALTALIAVGQVLAAPFDGNPDFMTDQNGWYYIVTGGKFPTGTDPNGATGAITYVTDDPGWGKPIDVWRTEPWFSDNASFALTLKNGASIVYDNNGIENGTYGDYYDETGSHGNHGLIRGYSMSNNFDYIYAGYFKLTGDTTLNKIVGYFDPTEQESYPYPFDPASSSIVYHMNIWSNVSGDLRPTNTGSFAGDVFSSDTTAGTFSYSYTGVDFVLADSSTYPIDRLAYTLDEELTLSAGVYWFSHDVSVVPEPSTIAGLLSMLVVGLAAYGWRRRKRTA